MEMGVNYFLISVEIYSYDVVFTLEFFVTASFFDIRILFVTTFETCDVFSGSR